MKTLTTAPPKLFELFPELKTAEEKAYKFLEIHSDNNYGLRRTGRQLTVDPKTVKNVYEHLMDTPEGIRFREKILSQTEDFYSAKTLTLLFEDYTREITRVEGMIAQCKDPRERLNLIKEKRMWMKNLLDAALACKPLTKVAAIEALEGQIENEKERYGDLLNDFGNPDTNN